MDSQKSQLKDVPSTATGAQVLCLSGNSVLLLKRENTGYYDGQYGLPSGKVGSHETPLEAITRECEEEANITPIYCKHLCTTITLQGGDTWLHYFYITRYWIGIICNNEPKKCSDLRFFPMNSLPENIIPSVRLLCDRILSTQIYD